MVHPFVQAYLKKGFPSIALKWVFKYKRPIKILANQNYHIYDHHFFNGKKDEIILWSEPTTQA